MQLALFVPIATLTEKRLGLVIPRFSRLLFWSLEGLAERWTPSWSFILKAMVRQIMRYHWLLVTTKIYLIAVCFSSLVVSPPYVIFMGADKHESEFPILETFYHQSHAVSIELIFQPYYSFLCY